MLQSINRCVMGYRVSSTNTNQPRTKATPKGKSKGKSATHDEDERAKKAAKRWKSREHAKEYRKGLPNWKGSDEGESDGTSDDGDDASDTCTSGAEEPAPTLAKLSPSPAALGLGPARNRAVRSSRSQQGMGTVPAVSQAPDVPPMPTPAAPSRSRPKHPGGRSTHQHQSLPNGNGGNNDSSGPPTPSPETADRRRTFLRHASTHNTYTPAVADTTGGADPVAGVSNGSRRKPETSTSETRAVPAEQGHQHHNGARRSTFLTPFASHVTADGTGDFTPSGGNVGVAGTQEDEDTAASHAGVARAQGRARIWSFNW